MRSNYPFNKFLSMQYSRRPTSEGVYLSQIVLLNFN